MSQSSPSSAAVKTPLLSNNVYNIAKHVASIGLPLAAALYYALGHIWSLPDVGQVMVSIASVNTVLGGILGYSTATYNASEAKYAGVIQVIEGDVKDVAQLILHDDTDTVLSRAEAIFKIERQPTSVSVTTTSTTGGTAHGASL
jgi:hypothetical protein